MTPGVTKAPMEQQEQHGCCVLGQGSHPREPVLGVSVLLASRQGPTVLLLHLELTYHLCITFSAAFSF
jgi:hypothetical protein